MSKLNKFTLQIYTNEIYWLKGEKSNDKTKQ